MFSGARDKPLAAVAAVITGTATHSNFGHTILGADVNSDGRSDLVVASPYAAGGGVQRGVVWVFLARRSAIATALADSDADATEMGRQVLPKPSPP